MGRTRCRPGYATARGNMATASNLSVTVSNAAPSGLLAAYGLKQGSGTTATDSSGNGITGTLSGATWTPAGKFGNALSFNGSSNYVDLGNPTALQTTGSITWTAWVKATSTPVDDGQIIAKSNGTSGWQFKTSPDTGSHRFAIAVSSGGGVLPQRNSNTVRVLNTWYHVAGVYNAAARTLDIYVNGVLDNGVLSGSATIPAAQTVPNINVNIGRRTGGFNFGGIIDEARVFNRALSQPEIQTLMNTPIAPVSAVNIQGFQFLPNPDTIARGSLVSWTNLDGATHHIVSDTGAFDTQNLTQGQSAIVAFPAAGTYTYHCQIHTSMVGTIVAQ